MNDPGSPKALSNLIFAPLRGLVDAILPNSCFVCGLSGGRQLVCAGCEALLPLACPASACPSCGLPETGGSSCGRCLRRPPAFDATICCYEYGFPLLEMLQSLKYSQTLQLAHELGARLARVVPAGDWDGIVAVPIHSARLRQRGFNQSLEIARPIARSSGIALWSDRVERVRDTPSQAGLRAAQRRRNLRGAFAVRGSLSGASLLVVDDVMTTGATLDELAATLKAAGAGRVTNLVIARTPPAAGRQWAA